MKLNNVTLSVQGPEGDFGLQGELGPDGANGSTGITGIQGLNGSNGLTGRIGNFGVAGLPGVHFVTPPFTGKSYIISTFNTTLISASPTGNLIRLTPMVPARTVKINSMSINITTGSAGVNHRILIYTDLNGAPNTKLIETANLDCSTIGVKTVATSFTLDAGTVYWIGGYSSGTITCQLIPSASLLLNRIGTNGVTITTFQYNYTFGTAPNSLNGVTISSTSNGSAYATYLTT